AILFKTVDGRDVWMIQRGEDFGFALEAGQAIRICAHRRWQHLDGDLSLQIDVGGPVHFAHSAFAELVDDSIWAERITWSHRLCSGAKSNWPTGVGVGRATDLPHSTDAYGRGDVIARQRG